LHTRVVSEFLRELEEDHRRGKPVIHRGKIRFQIRKKLMSTLPLLETCRVPLTVHLQRSRLLADGRDEEEDMGGNEFAYSRLQFLVLRNQRTMKIVDLTADNSDRFCRSVLIYE
jgi:hypothetical protein